MPRRCASPQASHDSQQTLTAALGPDTASSMLLCAGQRQCRCQLGGAWLQGMLARHCPVCEPLPVTKHRCFRKTAQPLGQRAAEQQLCCLLFCRDAELSLAASNVGLVPVGAPRTPQEVEHGQARNGTALSPAILSQLTP